MTRKSRRELERAIEEMETEDETVHTAAVELESGEYVTPAGDPVDWDTVAFAIPYELWNDMWGLDSPEDMLSPEGWGF